MASRDWKSGGHGSVDLLGAIPLDDQVIATTNKGVPAVLEGKSLDRKSVV